VLLVGEEHIEGLREVLAQEMARARLKRLAVLHHRLDAVGLDSAGEPFTGRLHPADHGYGEPFLGETGIYIEHAFGLLHRLLLRGVRRMAFLPEELRSAQEQPRAHLPAYHVRP